MARTLVLDIDGILCFDGRTIDDRIVEAIEECEQADYETVFASARPIRDLLPVLDGAFASATLIGGNGSLASVDGQVQAARSLRRCNVPSVDGGGHRFPRHLSRGRTVRLRLHRRRRSPDP